MTRLSRRLAGLRPQSPFPFRCSPTQSAISRLTRIFQPVRLPRSHRPTSNSFSYKLLCNSRHWRREALDFVKSLKHVLLRTPWKLKLEASLPSRRAMPRRPTLNKLCSSPLRTLVARRGLDLNVLAQRARAVGTRLQLPPNTGTSFLREKTTGFLSQAFTKLRLHVMYECCKAANISVAETMADAPPSPWRISGFCCRFARPFERALVNQDDNDAVDRIV
jgi:hypothetical protein